MRKLPRFAILLLGAAISFAACQKAPELTLTGPTSIDLSVDGGSGSISFTANRDWSVSSSDSWVTVSPSSGTASDGTVTVTVRCNANTTYDDRTATVTIRMEGLSQSVTVRQPANKGVVLLKQAYDLQSDAKTIDVEVQANVQYTVSTSVNWIKQTGTKGLSSKTLTFSIEENKTYDPREGKITIKPQEGNAQEQVISVKQAQKDALNVEKTTYDMPYGGGEIEIKVESNVSFDVSPNADWIHHTQTKALSSSTVCLKIDENETYSSREGTVEIKQQNGSLKHTITVNQAGRIAVTSVVLDKTSLNLNVGDSETLVATVKPDNATDKTVMWTSSDDTIATVDETGKVTAIKEGTATITAKAGEKTAECKVTVYVAVSSVELNKTTLSIIEGESETLTATVKPDNATDKTVTWSSSDEKIATVKDGKVTAVKVGEATITATAGDKTVECKVTVSPVPVSSVTLDHTSLELEIGETATLVASVKPDNAADKTVTWTSSDTKIATVDASGEVTAVEEGETTITAKAGDKKAECKVTVKRVPVTSVSLDKITLELTEGESASLTATVSPDNATDKTVTWSSSDATVATVDDNGKVTAVKAGTATITAKSGDKSASCAVTVKAAFVAVTSVELNKTSLELTEGNSETLTATVKPDNATDKTVTWSSSDSNIATVDGDGKVTALKEGTATITAKSGEKSATCSVTVSKKVIAVTSVTLDKPSASLKVGETVTLTATVKPDDATDKTVTWNTSDASIATVDANGKVTAVKEGTATITAKAGEKTATCKVTVSKNVIAVTSVTLNKTEMSLKEGESETLIATVNPDNATDKTVTWSTSDASIAAVDANGKVTAVKEGNAIITAKAGEKTATCNVLVSVPDKTGDIEGVNNEIEEW